MNKINYDKLMMQTIEKLDHKPSLMLHVCCAPCASTCLEKLYEHFTIGTLFYNPNIEDEEFNKRHTELIKFLDQTGWATDIPCPHDKDKFYELTRGMEDLPEGGTRCGVCFALRLQFAAQEAERLGYEYLTTSLTLSPLKDAQRLNEIGKKACEGKKVIWLDSDFKKRNGYLRSCQLSSEYGLYRQNYCGCIYSQNKQNLL